MNVVIHDQYTSLIKYLSSSYETTKTFNFNSDKNTEIPI